MKFSDIEVMAYVDGEADENLTKAIDAARPHDAELQALIVVMQQSRDTLASGLNQILKQPLPQATSQLLEMPQRSRRPRWAAVSLAMAASLILVASLLWLFPQTSSDPMARLMATAELQRALEQDISGELSMINDGEGQWEIMPRASYVTTANQYCRSFELSRLSPASATRHALACRDRSSTWELVATAEAFSSKPDQHGYQAASGELASHWPDFMASAQKLSPTEEQNRVQSRWQEN